MTADTIRARHAMNHVPAMVLGVLMSVLSVAGRHWTSVAIAFLSGAAVLVAIRFRWAAAGPVCLSSVNLAVSTPSVVQTAVAGLCAAGFLVAIHSTTSLRPRPVAAGFACGFTAIATAATLLPLDIAWMPLAAPFALLAAFTILAKPYTCQRDLG